MNDEIERQVSASEFHYVINSGKSVSLPSLGDLWEDCPTKSQLDWVTASLMPLRQQQKTHRNEAKTMAPPSGFQQNQAVKGRKKERKKQAEIRPRSWHHLAGSDRTNGENADILK